MRLILPISIVVICFATIVFGNISYKEKIEQVKANETSVEIQPSDSTSEKPATPFRSYRTFVKNWPNASKQLFKEKYEAGEPFTIFLVGSTAIDNDRFSLIDSLQTEMNEVFGSSVELKSKTYDMNSTQFIEGNMQDELAELGADMIIFEPLTYEDNKVGATTKSIEYLATVIEDVTAADENVTFVLQPPPPLYEAVNYPPQVGNLKTFAEENSITYLDYWSNFPEQGDEDRADYFEEGSNSLLNDEGYAIWVDYVKEFLIHEE